MSIPMHPKLAGEVGALRDRYDDDDDDDDDDDV